MPLAIQVDNLVKRFGNKTALAGVSFEVPEGEAFGLLGPNGAGKTTLVSILVTLLRPTAGQARVAGIPVGGDHDALRRCIGVVFQEPALDGRLTGRENLQLHSMMYGQARREREMRIAAMLELVGLDDRADTLVETYSGGMKRRLEIARGLIHRPHVLFLDEPTLGLDAAARRRIWDAVRRFNREEGVTIILTTHYMDEADALCDRVAIIDHGMIVALDTPGRLKDILGGDIVTLEVESAGERLEQTLQAMDWVKSSQWRGSRLSLTMEHGDRRIPELIEAARRDGAALRSVNLRRPSLEDVFLHFTGHSIRGEEAVHETQFGFVQGRGGG